MNMETDCAEILTRPARRILTGLHRDFRIFVLLCGLSWAIGEATYTFRKTPDNPGAATVKAPEIFSLAQFRNRVEQKQGLILDARSKEEYQQGHVPGAISFPGSYFEGSYIRLEPSLRDKSRPITLYCAEVRCGAADYAGREFRRLGYADVSVFPGGWKEWQAAKLPVEGGR